MRRPSRLRGSWDRASFIPTPIPYVTPANYIPPEPLQITFLLVGNREDEQC